MSLAEMNPAVQGIGIVCVVIVCIAAFVVMRRIVFGPRDKRGRRD